ncbi:MAG: MFS transporter [Cyclobacteriaceae bacterium]
MLVNFIGTMGYSIVLPFLVILVIKFGGNELIYGFLGATYSFFQLIGAPILGTWSDRFGRRKILLVSQVGTFVAWLIFLVALLVPETKILNFSAFLLTLPLGLLFIARALDGLTGGNVSVANAYMADISNDSNRKQNFGSMAASANLGFIIGPALAGLLGATYFEEVLPILAAMAISIMAIFVIAFRLEESKPCLLDAPQDTNRTRKIFGQEHKECHDLAGATNYGLSDLIKVKYVPLMLLLYFSIFLAFNFFYVAFPIHAIQGMQWSVLKLGIFFSILSGVMVLVQGPILTRLHNRVTETTLCLWGSVFLIISFCLFTLSQQSYMFAGALFFSIGNGVMWPSFLSILSRVGGSKFQGALQGYASSTGSLASIIGLILGGVIYSNIGVTIFYISAGLMLMIFIVSFQLIPIEKEETLA